MKKWRVDTAFGVDLLTETLNWIEEQGGTVFSVLFIRADPVVKELYRIVWFK